MTEVGGLVAYRNWLSKMMVNEKSIKSEFIGETNSGDRTEKI
jgi:hypothetical protein